MKKFLLPSLALMLAILGMGIMSQVSAVSTNTDSNFKIGLPIGFYQYSTVIKIQNNGKILVGGAFTAYRGVLSNSIIRLNADGTKDSIFNIGTGFNSIVNSLAIQSDGKVLVGGSFTNYNGTSANRLIRLNTDGSIDTSFNIGSGFNSNVNTTAIANDGKILVGGNFTGYNGSSVNRIIRLNTDGTTDTSFDMGSGFDGYGIYDIAIQSDGKIVVGGYFWKYNLTNANRIIRLNTDGTTDTKFIIGDGFNQPVHSIVIQNDGKILVGGQFTTYKGLNQSQLVRLNSDGTKDTEFMIGYFNSTVKSIAIQSGKIMVGGDFSNYSGASTNFIVGLNSDGTRDNSFDIGVGFNTSVKTIAFKNDGKIILGGNFSTYKGKTAMEIIGLNSDGTDDNIFTFSDGFDNGVNNAAIQSDGKIILGGSFKTYKGTIANSIIRLNPDGSIDSGYNIGIGFSALFSSTIYAMNLENDGKILVGGSFLRYKGVTTDHIVRLDADGNIDSSFQSAGFGASTNLLLNITKQSDGNILVGGSFTTYSGVTVGNIVRLYTNGGIDTTFNAGGNGFNGAVYSAIQSNNKIIAGGQFTTYNGIAALRIIRLNDNGSIDSTFNVGGTGFNSMIETLAIQSDGKILVGGNFTTYNGASENYITRLNTDGTKDSTFNIGGSGFNAGVKNIRIQSDGKFLIGGSFINYNGTSANRLIRLNTDGTMDTSFNVGGGFNGNVNTTAIANDGKILVGGGFSNYNGIPAGYLVSLYGDTTGIVILPNSTNTTTINNEFTTKGYIQSDGNLVGSASISLDTTNGNIPSALSLQNNNIKLNIPANTQFKQADNTTNFDGIISVPSVRSTSSVNNESVVTAFKVGSSTESIKLIGGLATLSVPAPGKTVGESINVYYSEDNGVSWYPQVTTTVVNIGGQPSVSFTTNHFTDFAITLPIGGNFIGTFMINNDDTSTTSSEVALNISTTPAAAKMRFSDDGTSWSTRENYTTTKARTLPGSSGVKTVYAQFDTDGDGTSDVITSDYITYSTSAGESSSCTPGSYCGDLTLQVLSGNSYCQYGTTLNFGTTGSSYSARSLSTGFIASGGSTARFCEDKQGLGTRALTIQSSAIVNTTTNVSAHTIPATSVSIKNPNAYIAQGACTFSSGESQNQRVAIDSAKSILGKVGTVGEGCKIITDTVSLKVDLVAAQAIGQYSGTLTITVPNF